MAGLRFRVRASAANQGVVNMIHNLKRTMNCNRCVEIHNSCKRYQEMGDWSVRVGGSTEDSTCVQLHGVS